MPTATPLTKRTPTQRQRKQGNPFRSYDEGARYTAAAEMMEQRAREIEQIYIRLSLLPKRSAEHRMWSLRLKAAQNNLASWRDYINQGAQREPRAVIVPA